MRLGELLIQQGLLNESQLRTALRTQEFFGGHLGSILIDLGFIEESALGETLSKAAGVRYATPDLLEDIPEQVVQALPGKVADRHKAVPIRIQQKRLHLAMLNPKDLVGLDEISYLTGMVVVPYVAPEFRVFRALERYYGVQRLRPDRISVSGKIHEDLGVPETETTTKALSATESVLPAGIGLDGLPLDAEIDRDEAATVAAPSSPASSEPASGTDVLLEQLPRSLDEWREGADSRDAVPSPAAAMASPLPETMAKPEPEPGPEPEAALPPKPDQNERATDPVQEAADRFLAAETREDVAEVLLNGSGRYFRRRLLFFLQRDRIVGWDGWGDDIVQDRVKDILLPTESLSMFTAVKDGPRPFRGPVTDLPTNRRLYEDLGISSPTEVLLLPITLKGRVISVLYGDNGSEPIGTPDLAALGRLTVQAALALEILILRNKLQSV